MCAYRHVNFLQPYARHTPRVHAPAALQNAFFLIRPASSQASLLRHSRNDGLVRDIHTCQACGRWTPPRLSMLHCSSCQQRLGCGAGKRGDGPIVQATASAPNAPITNIAASQQFPSKHCSHSSCSTNKHINTTFAKLRGRRDPRAVKEGPPQALGHDKGYTPLCWSKRKPLGTHRGRHSPPLTPTGRAVGCLAQSGKQRRHWGRGHPSPPKTFDHQCRRSNHE